MTKKNHRYVYDVNCVALTGLPLGPSSPGGPLGPAGPAEPGGPASPFSPLSPFGPCRVYEKHERVECRALRHFMNLSTRRTMSEDAAYILMCKFKRVHQLFMSVLTGLSRDWPNSHS